MRRRDELDSGVWIFGERLKDAPKRRDDRALPARMKVGLDFIKEHNDSRGELFSDLLRGDEVFPSCPREHVGKGGDASATRAMTDIDVP